MSLKQPKLLILRHKLQHRPYLNVYTSFSNAIQYPGLLLNTPMTNLLNPPSLSDYFGCVMSNLPSDTRTDKISLQNNFDILNPLDKNSRCKTLFQDETRPRFFFVESRLVIQSNRGGHGEKSSKFFSFEDHYVAIIYKDNHYYICPGEENSLIYRVGCPQRMFLTEEGHGILSILLGNSLGTNFGFFRFRLLIPKQHMNCGFVNICDWDHTSKCEIEIHVPFPVLSSATVSKDCHSSVQVVTLNDDIDFVVDVLVEGEGHDGSDDESLLGDN